MIVYAIVILIIVILRLNLDDSQVGRPDYEKETTYLRIICGILVLLAATRGANVGADTLGYIYDYENVQSMTIVEVGERYTFGAGYYWFSKLFSLTGLSVQWWFGVVELFYVFAFYKFIQAFSSDKLVSILCFFTIGFFSFSLAGLKQTTAMGFTLLTFLAIYNKKYIMAGVLGLLAFWSHYATSCFAFGVILYYFRNKKFYYPLLFTFLAIVVLAGDALWSETIGMLGDEHYDGYAVADDVYSNWTFLNYLLILFMSLFYWKKYNENDQDEAKLLYGMTIVAIAFQSLATTYSTAFRIAYYFTPFTCLLISNCSKHTHNSSGFSPYKVIMCIVCTFWMLYTNRDFEFSFFWQN